MLCFLDQVQPLHQLHLHNNPTFDKQNTQREVDHGPRIAADGPISRISVRNGHGRLYGQSQLFVENQKVGMFQDFGNLQADPLVDLLANPVALVVEHLLKRRVQPLEAFGKSRQRRRVLQQSY